MTYGRNSTFRRIVLPSFLGHKSSFISYIKNGIRVFVVPSVHCRFVYSWYRLFIVSSCVRGTVCSLSVLKILVFTLCTTSFNVRKFVTVNAQNILLCPVRSRVRITWQCPYHSELSSRHLCGSAKASLRKVCCCK
jgi:hypothetical protein